MADLRSMDVEAANATVTAFSGHADFLASMYAAVKAAADGHSATWNGQSKAQFEGAWTELTTAVNGLQQRLGEFKERLAAEIRQVEETFSA